MQAADPRRSAGLCRRRVQQRKGRGADSGPSYSSQRCSTAGLYGPVVRILATGLKERRVLAAPFQRPGIATRPVQGLPGSTAVTAWRAAPATLRWPPCPGGIPGGALQSARRGLLIISGVP